MKNGIIGIIVIIILALGAWWLWGGSSTRPASDTATTGQSETSDRTLIASVAYACDGGKTITASYYEGPEAPQPEPGEPPHPTGSADVSLDGGPTTTLMQTISADGTRYSTSDESFTFWSKGDSALIMRNNSMDLTYTNCTAQE